MARLDCSSHIPQDLSWLEVLPVLRGASPSISTPTTTFVGTRKTGCKADRSQTENSCIELNIILYHLWSHFSVWIPVTAMT